jgi:hypothetical protein
MIRRHALLVVIALVLALAGWQSTAGQRDERLADCEEVTVAGRVSIGHNCGEVASILISGRIVIERPWSRVNSASRAERLRRRGGTTRSRPEPTATATSVAEPTRAPRPEPTNTPTETPRDGGGSRDTTSRNGGNGGNRGGNGSGQDVDCNDFKTQREAQKYFDKQGWSATNDPYGLDEAGQGNGIACESLPSR